MAELAKPVSTAHSEALFLSFRILQLSQCLDGHGLRVTTISIGRIGTMQSGYAQFTQLDEFFKETNVPTMKYHADIFC